MASEGTKPPNLREAPLDALMQGASCESCHHYADQKCRLYGDWPVQPSDICDTYEPMREPRRQPA